MSMLVSWVGADSHGHTSAYIASDSRISWKSEICFDYSRKLFSSKKYPEIFGYVGDVLFPLIVLSQVIELIDSDMLLGKHRDSRSKNKIVFEKIRYELSKYPTKKYGGDFKIIHLSRNDTTEGKYPGFKQYVMSYNNKTGTITCVETNVASKSQVILAEGTGAKQFNEIYNQRLVKNGFTTRNCFSTFVKTLKNNSEATVGGPPQLIGLYRKKDTFGIDFGIIYNRKRYFLGTEVPKKSLFSNIEWRNSWFEICDGTSKQRKPGAKKQSGQ